MDAHHDFVFLQETLIILGAVSIVIPLFHRLRASPVLGFLLIGMLLGPNGAGALLSRLPGMDWIVLSDRERLSTIAELGVIFLMFTIGLELSFERLMTMRRLVFGLGPIQLLLCAAAIASVAVLALGATREEAIVVGLALSLSSTAVIIQVLSEERRLATVTGRTSFAMLLFQDIAVVPILFAVSIIGAAVQGAPGGNAMAAFALALGQAAIAVALVVAAGRLLLRPLFRSVARTNSPEVFMAACLLVLLGASVATAAAGMSMAMGALLAGVLLAETEYRRQIEVLIEPFKGLLLGVFLISMGMTIDLAVIAAAPVLILGAALGLILVKAALTFGAARLFNVAQRPALQTGLLMGPGGEFSFVVLGAATALGLVSARVGEVALIVAALTMASVPLLSALGRRGERKAPEQAAPDPALSDVALDDAPRVIIVGFGRVGQVVADMLRVHDVPYVAVDSDVDAVVKARKRDQPVYFGDATHPMFLQRLGLANARALVVTMDSGAGAEQVVEVARNERTDLTIVARARDDRHAARLYAKGATDAVPETVESSLLLSETLLVDVGVPMGPVIASIHDRRAQFRTEIQRLAPEAFVAPMRRRRLADLVRLKSAQIKQEDAKS